MTEEEFKKYNFEIQRIDPSVIRLGLYVTFIVDTGIYRVEEDINIRAYMLDEDATERRWILKQTHKLDKGVIIEVENDYHMMYNPGFHLIQTKETLVLNRESQLNKLLR